MEDKVDKGLRKAWLGNINLRPSTSIERSFFYLILVIVFLVFSLVQLYLTGYQNFTILLNYLVDR